MRRFVLFALSLLILNNAFAQRRVSPSEQEELVGIIASMAGKVSTLQCQFVQTKKLALLNEEMISKGIMYFDRNSKLRWEYISPYTYTFIFNGSKVMLKSARKKDVIDVQSSHIFREIAKIMMFSVTGRCLSLKDEFKITMFQGPGDELIAQLEPLTKQMKQMFSTIRLHLDQKNGMVTKVEMTERTGDTTSIQLINTKLNIPIDGKIFDID